MSLEILKDTIVREYEEMDAYVKRKGVWEYTGRLGGFSGCYMPPIAKRFYNVWKCQGVRCGSPSYHSYDKYGGVGVRRKCSSRAFVNWCINEMLRRNIWYEPTVARVGDTGNYEFGNIKLIEKSENSAEISNTYRKVQAASRNSRESRYKTAKEINKVKMAIETAISLLGNRYEKSKKVDMVISRLDEVLLEFNKSNATLKKDLGESNV